VVTPKPPEKKKPAEGEEEEAPPDEEEEAANLKPQLQKHIYPESVVHLRASTLFLKRRAKQFLAEAEKNKEKWHISRLQEKINLFNSQNSMDLFKEQEKFPTTKFF